ncbi:MAG: STAS domain-containing protein [Candidatus Omnitrophota bacterium]
MSSNPEKSETKITQKIKNGTLVCYVSGDITIQNSEDVAAVFTKIAAENHRKVILNLKDVGYIDSRGLACLVQLSNQLKAIQGILFLCELPVTICTLFEITNLNKVIKIYETENDALQDLYGQ